MATSQEQILTCKLCYFRNKGWAMRCTPPINEYLSRLVHTSNSKHCYWSNKFLKPQAFFWPWQSTSKPVELRWAAKIHNFRFFRFRFQWVKSLNSQPSQLTCHVGLLLRKQGAVPGSQERHRFTFEMRRIWPLNHISRQINSRCSREIKLARLTFTAASTWRTFSQPDSQSFKEHLGYLNENHEM